jgi:glycosyltransferase involved in cell wall biosynthesis
MEIFVVDGMSNDKTREIVSQYEHKFDFITMLDNPDKIVPKAMNIAIDKASGEYIIRLDAHSEFPKNYFSDLIQYSKMLNADNIGAVIITEVKHKNSKSNSIKRALSHKFGVGNSDFRTGIKSIKEVDTVPFGCYKKSVFTKYGMYDERLIRNQDIELNKRIINGGGKIYLIPDVKCTYYARKNFTDLAKNNYANGFWNILTAYYTKTFNSLSLRHFIPLLFVLSLIIPLVGSLIVPQLLWIAVFSLASYLSLVIIISFSLKNSSNTIGYLIMSFLTLHLSYGWGSLMGIFSVISKYIKGEK